VRILIVHPNYYGPPWSEGVANIARRLVKYLVERGHEVAVVAAGMNLATESRRDGEFGEEIHLVPPSADRTVWGRSRFWWSFIRRAGRVRHSFRAESALVFSGASLAFSPRAFLFRRVLRCDTCFYVSGLNRPLFAINWFRDNSRVIVGSPFLQRWFPNAPIAHPVTPIHLEPDANGACPANPGPVLQLLFLGALQKERGVGYLIEGVAAARHMTERELRLVIAINSRGEPGSIAPLAGIEALIARLQVGEAVELRGIADTNQLYREADVVIIPRQQPTKMSFPVRILESLSFGKPLIVTTMCDMGQLVEGCGLVVDPTDPQDLARAIVRLAEDPELYSKLSAGCAPALRRYDPEIALETIHTRLVGG
jgi:glycosyltransferase involved in cell wall biosynthesis